VSEGEERAVMMRESCGGEGRAVGVRGEL